MNETKRLRIDLDELCEAFDSTGPDQVWYLDLETGELLFTSVSLGDPEGIEERVDSDAERYEAIPTLDSQQGYQDMEAFIATLTDRHIADLLEVAIDGSGAFRRFRDVLARFPAVRDRWFRFKEGLLHALAVEWLAELGIEPL